MSKMKKQNEHKTLWLMWIVMGLWLLCLLLSIWLFIHKDQGNLLDILFQVVNILFSGIAIIVAYISYVYKSKDYNKQIDVKTFSETIQKLVESDKFCESRMYILSALYDRDIDNAKRLVGKKDINLDDIKKLCGKGKNSRLTVVPAIEYLYTSYKTILNFSSEMEYLGTLYNKGIASDYIIEYYRKMIIETYEKLCPLLCGPKKNAENYPYYKKMYIAAKNVTKNK